MFADQGERLIMDSGPETEFLNRRSKRNRMNQILTFHFDLEILHKYRECRIIEEELERGKALLSNLEKLLLLEFQSNNTMISDDIYLYSYPNSRSISPFPSSYDTLSYNESPFRRNLSYASFFNNNNTKYIAPSTEPSYQYDVTAEGVVVRMKCPKCDAEKFRSMLGFLNHCRIHCRLLFNSQDDRLLKCGIPVEDLSEIPPDYFTKHPTQIKQELDLAQIRASVQPTLIESSKKPTIREFDNTNDEFFDMEPMHDDVVKLHCPVPSSSLISQSLDVLDLESRLCWKRRITIISKVIKMNEKNAEGKDMYKWSLSLIPFSEIDDVYNMIKRVTFYIHSSYKPNDILTVDEKPFEINEKGWNEFPVRIKLDFDDDIKSINLIYNLQLFSGPISFDQNNCSVSETSFDLEINKNNETAVEKKVNFEDPVSNYEELSNLSLVSSYSEYEQTLMAACKLFPLYHANDEESGNQPQLKSKISFQNFLKLPISDQLCMERERASNVWHFIKNNFINFNLTIDDTIMWCRRKGFTPLHLHSQHRLADNFYDLGTIDNKKSIIANSIIDNYPNIEKLKYCRYCGLSHFPQERFEILQKNCTFKPRKLHLSSRTSSSTMLSKFEISKDPIIEHTSRKRDLNNSSFFMSSNPEYITETKIHDKNDVDLEGQWINDLCIQLELHRYCCRVDTLMTMKFSLRAFISELIRQSSKKIPQNIERKIGNPVLLTPLHIYLTITNLDNDSKEEINEKFDFLTNKHMSGTI